ncbi:MAG TPA: YIP1 family protein [Vicinamibacteria bacterium]|nr:YIP1 family protein [Vicinamibacteria bacterium]
MAQCPYCAQPLPEPPDRSCPSCGRDLPAPMPPPAAGGTPWERRAQIGFVNALIDTTRGVLTGPTAFFRSMPVMGGIGAPLGYGVIVGYIGLVAQALYQAIFRSVLGSGLGSLAGRPEWERLATTLQSGLGLVIQVILGPAILTVGLFLSAGIVHLMLMLLGGARRNFEATFRVACYAEAPALFALLPFCGGIVGVVYRLVLYIIGLAEAHQIGKGTSAAAVLLPILLVCCCCAAAIAISVGGLAALVSRAR